MDGYEVCEKCNGRGILLNTIRNHWVDNSLCHYHGTCGNVLVDICSICCGYGEVSWLDRAISKKYDLSSEIISRVHLQLKEIFWEGPIKKVGRGDVQ
jgi:hypothetical protein